MSRIGKSPVVISGKVSVVVNGNEVIVSGGGHELKYVHRPEVRVYVDESQRSVLVERFGESRMAKAMHGLTRALISNMVQGVQSGFIKELDVVGVGWTAAVEGDRVALNVGYADTRYVPIPSGVKVEIKTSRIKVSGPDKQAVGQLAARVRAQRPPEPYNGKGIKYSDERIVRKAGKAFAGGG